MTRCSQPRRCRAMLRRRTIAWAILILTRCGRLGEPDCHLRGSRSSAGPSALRDLLTLAIAPWCCFLDLHPHHLRPTLRHEFSHGEHKTACAFPATRAGLLGLHLFSFVVGMTFQVSDVAVMHKMARRTVVAHGALSFSSPRRGRDGRKICGHIIQK